MKSKIEEIKNNNGFSGRETLKDLIFLIYGEVKELRTDVKDITNRKADKQLVYWISGILFSMWAGLIWYLIRNGGT